MQHFFIQEDNQDDQKSNNLIKLQVPASVDSVSNESSEIENNTINDSKDSSKKFKLFKKKTNKPSPMKTYLKSMLEQCHSTFKMQRLESLQKAAKSTRIPK